MPSPFAIRIAKARSAHDEQICVLSSLLLNFTINFGRSIRPRRSVVSARIGREVVGVSIRYRQQSSRHEKLLEQKTYLQAIP